MARGTRQGHQLYLPPYFSWLNSLQALHVCQSVVERVIEEALLVSLVLRPSPHLQPNNISLLPMVDIPQLEAYSFDFKLYPLV